MLRTKVKASAVTNLTDARYFAAREVEWLGFRLDGPPDGVISLAAARAIAEWVDGVRLVGEFEFPSADDLRAAQAAVPFDALQVGMFTPVEVLRALPSTAFVKEVVVSADTEAGELAAHLEAYAPYCQWFLLDFAKSGLRWQQVRSGRPIALASLRQLAGRHPVIVALDLLPVEVGEVLDLLQPAGLSLAGGNEERVGLKSFDDLDEIFDLLEVAM